MFDSSFEDWDDISDYDAFDDEFSEQSADFRQPILIDKSVSHITIQIRDVEVLFPYKPYEPQIAYMEQVIDALNGKQNALLQSPTGTGKTLCLLCATLAWLYKNNCEGFGGKKIYYATRTLSQIKQVFGQLKKTCYRPVTTYLCSRDHCCPKFKEKQPYLKGSFLNQECKKATETTNGGLDNVRCGYYRNFKKNEKNFLERYSTSLLDIEDLYQEGKKVVFCPYYLERAKQEIAHLIFMPYNYLMNKSIRKSSKIEIADSIVIFDEAHNIEKLAEESRSFEISLDNFEECKREFDVLSKGTKFKETGYLEYAVRSLAENFSKIKDDLQEELRGQKTRNVNEVHKFFEGREIFKLLEEGTKNPKMNQYKTIGGKEFQNGFNKDNLQDVLEVLGTISDLGAIYKLDLKGLKTLRSFLKKVFKLLEQDIIAKEVNLQKDFRQNPIESYKLLCHLEEVEIKQGLKKRDLKIKMVCLNPGVGFYFVREENGSPHSLILTSGTLSPMKSFESELMIDFPIQFDNSHVIDTKTQCKTFIVKNGQNKSPIKFTYQNRENNKMIEDTGYSLVEIAKLVPNGVLVCFASKSLMNQCIKLWGDKSNRTSVMSQLSKEKDIYEEPQNAQELDAMIEGYKRSVKKKGAVLFCYCRGRVSEGIDFADEMARAVVLIGIPLLTFVDPQIKLKKQFLSEKLERLKSGLTENEWYTLQATRAANQALGRVIRHKDDYGLVFLFDERHNQEEYNKELPKWIRSNVANYDFETIKSQIALFFESKKPSFMKINEKTYEEQKDFHSNRVSKQEEINTQALPVLSKDFYKRLALVLNNKNNNSQNYSQQPSQTLMSNQSNNNIFRSYENSSLSSSLSGYSMPRNNGNLTNYSSNSMEIEYFNTKCVYCSQPTSGVEICQDCFNQWSQ